MCKYKKLYEKEKFHKERYRNMLSDNICYDCCANCREQWYEGKLKRCACREFKFCEECLLKEEEHGIDTCEPYY